MKPPGIVRLASRSCVNYVKLIAQGGLHLRTNRLVNQYSVEDGRWYRIFRETVRTADTSNPAVLVVGFKLRWLGDQGWGHWLFQRVCILTTPFWSGFSGFRVKLWMVAPPSGHYLGIYEWDGTVKADRYVQALVRVLQPLSLPQTVWYRLHPGTQLEPFLQAHEAMAVPKDEEGHHASATV